ncbi:hypothetical protein BpHYR1_013385 [Brachionus plicatilis]|uniref:Uncharacterized protein n=1 Tax=Brachionus plicatilis TaxID=10195 RepID=A0A3M7T2H1_BRAPC|nr:hypothetical protein BpHYR1_013385 [Brachionus plicatilis]
MYRKFKTIKTSGVSVLELKLEKNKIYRNIVQHILLHLFYLKQKRCNKICCTILRIFVQFVFEIHKTGFFFINIFMILRTDLDNFKCLEFFELVIYLDKLVESDDDESEDLMVLKRSTSPPLVSLNVINSSA